MNRQQPLPIGGGRRRILITGATGYIGRRLEERLLARNDLAIRILVRNRNKVRPSVRDRVEIVEGDTFQRENLDRALAGVDTAYYLIHSMGQDGDFGELDRRSAENFREAAVRAGVRRLVYLGGLGVRATASEHLQSRLETGEILSSHPEKLQTIWLRAGVIIGAGSASFEIIYHLVQKLPVLITPTWVRTRTQPVAVADVVRYLEAAADVDVEGDRVVDIGSEVTSFRAMLEDTAAVLGLRRRILPVPVLSPRLSSYWLVLMTPVPYRLASALVEGLKSETVVLNDDAGRLFPDIRPVSFRQAVAAAVDEMAKDGVLSRWCDSSAGTVCDILGQDDPSSSILRDRREILLAGARPEAVFRAACAIGGRHGWYRYSPLWRLRGMFDKLVGGCGLSRGRRAEGELRVGDALDFWKVADLRENRRLLLLAQMKLPGHAWLEFDIREDRLVQTAHFLPRGLLGRLYWYAVSPFHHLVFSDLAHQIVARARREAAG
ncbi:MAG: SDR family oxidoreductase [Thermodesulfobacteriota bacterium]